MEAGPMTPQPMNSNEKSRRRMFLWKNIMVVLKKTSRMIDDLREDQP